MSPDVIANLPDWARIIADLGLTGFFLIAIWALLTRRVVTKATYDEMREGLNAEANQVRVFYERQMVNERREWEQRLDEWRGFRAEERARATESDQHLRLQVEITKELGRSLGEARVELGRIAGLLAHLAEQHTGEDRIGGPTNAP